MDPRVMPVSRSNSSRSSAFNERPLPPLPISDEEDLAGGFDATNQGSYNGEEISAGSQGVDQSSGLIARSGSNSEETRRLPDGPTRAPSSGPCQEAGSQLVNEESMSTVADLQRDPSVKAASQLGTSFAAEVDARFNPLHVRNVSPTSAPPRSSLRSENSSGSDIARHSGLRGHIAIRTRDRQQDLEDVADTGQAPSTVPRWQSDATVTFCPICRTQFSFFVRKHHCRKCGRVVCGSCSPHRITIPYQYIVQPTAAEQVPATVRPRLNSGRTGSSNMVDNLGGGERVRLCNPCVPDPNIAPPQVPESRSFPPRPPHQGHSRSVSSTVNSTYTRSSTHNPSASLATNAQRRTRDPSSMASYNTSSSYTERNSRIRPVDLQNRSRSSTVGTNQTLSNVGNSTSNPGQWTSTPGRSGHPHTPSQHPPPAPRPVIKEEDECWICHKELPSRVLIDWEEQRIVHVNNCLALATQGLLTSFSPSASSTPAPAPAPMTIGSRDSRMTAERGQETNNQTNAAASGSTSTSTTTSTPAPAPAASRAIVAALAASTPASRERDHAATVNQAIANAASNGAAPIRRSGVVPYKATEKDCIQDAECTICLEEFEVGQEMGRLECFCRFHLWCIREWFVNKPGQCPVHQHRTGH